MIERKTPPTQDVFNDPTYTPYTRGPWVCYMFGGNMHNDAIVTWRPQPGKHPNAFWRKMQYLCFGNVWIKDK